MTTHSEALRNYRILVAKIDGLSSRISAEFGESISCRKGCDDCCRHITLFPVEAFALATALHGLPDIDSERIRNLARSSSPESCPLLENGICLLYRDRPVICRTHGLPLLISGEGEKILDFCTKNFNGISSFAAGKILDLDLLNTTLAAINDVFVASRNETLWRDKERLSIAEALLIEL